jgi:branched-chain amino acid transport system permease protein
MSPVAVGATTLLLAAACAGPFIFAAQPYVLHVLTLTLCYAIPAIAVNLLFGYTGLVSLGHMGFAGVGAYTTALLMKSAGWPFIAALGAGAVGAGLIGLLVGIPCLRLRSHFFIIVTLAVGMILYTLFNNLDWLTGGAEGLPGIPRPQPLDLGFRVIDFRRPEGFCCSTCWCAPISAARSRPCARTRPWRRRAASTCSRTSSPSSRSQPRLPASAGR